MQNSLKLTEVVSINEKISAENGGKYLRVKFKGVFNNNDNDFKEENVICSMSIEQWEQIKQVMKVFYENDNIITKNPILLKFDPLAKTNTTPPKLLLKNFNGTHKGYPYDFWEMNVGVLIQNGVVEKSIIKKDYSIFFRL